jgi:hypothetical protein
MASPFRISIADDFEYDDYINKEYWLLSIYVKRNTEGHKKNGRTADICETMAVSDFIMLRNNVVN